MPTTLIRNFRKGMDRRRMITALEDGACWTIKNAHISRDGDIERMRALPLKIALPAGTFGLHSFAGWLVVFGSAAKPASLPPSMLYRRLQHPGGLAMTGISWAGNFNKQIYAIASFADGSVHHFIDETRVTEWDSIASSGASLAATAQEIASRISEATGLEARSSGAVVTVFGHDGQAFTISAGATNGGSVNDQAIAVATPVAAVAPVTATAASIEIPFAGGAGGIAALSVSGVQLISESIGWNGSVAATVMALTRAISSNSDVTGFTAVSSGRRMTIIAPPGTAYNDVVVDIALSGLMIAQISPAILTGGVAGVTAVDQVSTLTISGTVEPSDIFTVTINGTAIPVATGTATKARYATVAGHKVYAVVRDIARFCDLDDATDWSTGNSGFIDISTEYDGQENARGIGRYQGMLAIFVERAIQLWEIAADPANNRVSSTIQNATTVAHQSVTSVGNIDLFYLGVGGIRSVRARDQNNLPYVSEVGTAIDPFVQEHMRSLSAGQVSSAVGAIDPLDGRFMLALGNRVYVFSYFPANKVSAWSYYDIGFTISQWAVNRSRLYCRSGDKIYLYGGDSGNEYPGKDELQPFIQLPFFSGGNPDITKSLTAIAISSEGEWKCRVLSDPDDDRAQTAQVRLEGTTFGHSRTGIAARGSYLSVTIEGASAGESRVAEIGLVYQDA